VAYDPKPKGNVPFDGVDILKPNRSESFELAGIKAEHHDDYPAAEICESIWQRHHPRYLIISLGAKGMLHSERGVLTSPAPGAPIEEAVHLANAAAGVVVAQVGVAVAHPKEIIEYAASHG
jgi:bifunctional ADP-heptose synthase (sugar kinase/adenylyltransferase)